MVKVFEIWPGRNRFCCKGHCITGPLSDCAANSCYYVVAILIMVPYYIFLAPKLWNDITPALPICTSVCLALSLTFYLLTSCTDPGIIPRRALLERKREEFQDLLMPNANPNNVRGERKFCDTCLVFRPLKASHCSVCQNCVEVFDHHCPFVNNCVGKRNYRYFIGFLLMVVLTLFMAGLSLIIFLINNTGGGINPVVIIVISCAVAGLIGVPLLGFLIFHMVLVCKKTTTRELIKHESNQAT